MAWQYTAYVIPTLFAAVVAFLLCIYGLVVLRERELDATLSVFLGFALAILVWTGFSALKLSHTDPSAKLVFYRALHVGIAVLPPLVLLFALSYTDRTRWLRPSVVGIVFLVPIAFVWLLALRPATVVHGWELVGTDPVVVRVIDGPGFLVFSAYGIVLAAISIAIVLAEAVRVGRTYYPQAALFGLGVGLPMVAGALTNVGVSPFSPDTVNFVPATGAVSVLALGALLFRYRLFDLPPLAYATAMKHSPDGVLVLDADGRIVHANASGEAMLEHLGGSIGDELDSILHGFGPGDSGSVLEVDDERMAVDVQSKALRRGGRAVGWVVVIRDVTAERDRERTLERQRDRLDEFAATVSHDLKNPLHVARGFLELAREDADTEYHRNVDRALARMADIIDDLLVLARAGTLIDDLEPVDVGRIAKLAWESVETDDVTFVVDADRTIEADATTLRHVFENLFRNAVEHGGDVSRITVDDLEEGFLVEDDGVGIPTEKRESVFEPGYTTAADGTGYGLHIVRSIVDAHGWSLFLTEGAAGGTRVEVTGVDRA